MKYIVKKVLTLIITLLIVSLLAFLAFSVIPGDPTTKMLGTEATEEAKAALRAELGLDRPVFVRYIDWLFSFIGGDFGTSYNYNMPVSEMLADKLPITAALTVMGFALTVIIALPLGLFAGSIKNKAADTATTAANQVVMSIPAFFIGIMICYLCGNVLKMFVPGMFVSYNENPAAFVKYLSFAALSIAIPRAAMTIKMLKGSISSEMAKNYVITATSRGNSRVMVLIKHVFKNALVPVISFLAVSLAEIMTGAIIIEQVFTIPGIGRLLLSSISSRDFPVVLAIVVIMASWIVIINFVADVLYQLIDPRIRIK